MKKQTDLAGHIIRSIILPKTLQKETAETSLKKRKRKRTTVNISRKGSIVKEKCSQLTHIALDLFRNHVITQEDLRYLVVRYVGGDRATIRAYMGYKGRIRQRSSGESYVQGEPKKGYLETFGFMHPISKQRWFIHGQEILPTVPPAPPSPNIQESLIQKKSVEKISLSPTVTVDEFGKCVVNGKTVDIYKINNNNNTVRERNFRTFHGKRQTIIKPEQLHDEKQQPKV